MRMNKMADSPWLKNGVLDIAYLKEWQKKRAEETSAARVAAFQAENPYGAGKQVYDTQTGTNTFVSGEEAATNASRYQPWKSYSAPPTTTTTQQSSAQQRDLAGNWRRQYEAQQQQQPTAAATPTMRPAATPSVANPPGQFQQVYNPNTPTMTIDTMSTGTPMNFGQINAAQPRATISRNMNHLAAKPTPAPAPATSTYQQMRNRYGDRHLGGTVNQYVPPAQTPSAQQSAYLHSPEYTQEVRANTQTGNQTTSSQQNMRYGGIDVNSAQNVWKFMPFWKQDIYAQQNPEYATEIQNYQNTYSRPMTLNDLPDQSRTYNGYQIDAPDQKWKFMSFDQMNQYAKDNPQYAAEIAEYQRLYHRPMTLADLVRE